MYHIDYSKLHLELILMAINALHGIPKKQFKHKNGNELK